MVSTRSGLVRAAVGWRRLAGAGGRGGRRERRRRRARRAASRPSRRARTSSSSRRRRSCRAPASRLQAWIWPTAPGGSAQVVAGQHDGEPATPSASTRPAGATLWLDGQAVCDRPCRCRRATWYRLSAACDVARGHAHVAAGAAAALAGRRETARGRARERRLERARRAVPPGRSQRAGDGALQRQARGPAAARRRRHRARRLGPRRRPASDHVADASGGGRHARCVNLPMRAVTGHAWRGETTDFRAAPDEYAAIWFHDDDLDDAGWEPTSSLTCPTAWPSGVYAIRLDADDGEDTSRSSCARRAAAGRRRRRAAADAQLPGLRQRARLLAAPDPGHARARPDPRACVSRDATATSPTTGCSRSTSATPTAAGSPTRRACGRSSTCARATACRSCGRPAPVPGRPGARALARRRRASPSTWSPTRTCTPRAARCSRPIASLLTGSHPEYWTGRCSTRSRPGRTAAAG